MKTTFAVHWHYGVATHSGWFRMLNEDRSLLRIGTTDQGEPYAVAVIADGMGGTGDGSLASDSALECVRQWLDQCLGRLLRFQDKELWSQVEVSVDRLFHDIHSRLLQLGSETGMQLGTTLTLLMLLNETYFLCHVGDCRIYKVNSRRTHMRQLTKDQSWTAEQVRKRRMSNQTARKHVKRHILLQSLGMQAEPKLIKRMGFYNASHLFLLCSDGLYDRLTGWSIVKVLQEEERSNSELQQISDRLVNLALDRRAGDNISVMLLRPLRPSFSPVKRMWHRLKNFHFVFPAAWRK